jgi:hypothetical protein
LLVREPRKGVDFLKRAIAYKKTGELADRKKNRGRKGSGPDLSRESF